MHTRASYSDDNIYSQTLLAINVGLKIQIVFSIAFHAIPWAPIYRSMCMFIIDQEIVIARLKSQK